MGSIDREPPDSPVSLDGDVLVGNRVVVGLVEAPARLGVLDQEVGRLIARLARLLVEIGQGVGERIETSVVGHPGRAVGEPGAQLHRLVDRGGIGHVFPDELRHLVRHHRGQAGGEVLARRVVRNFHAPVLVVVEPLAGLLT